MLISSYNPREMGDTLVVILNADVATQASEQKGDVVRIFDAQTNQSLGYNFLNVSKVLENFEGNGQIFLAADQVTRLNQALSNAGFEAELTTDNEPKFVVGYVESMEPHPDSDHLNITTTVVDNGQSVQIVSGSPNMQTGIKVVVAKVGAMMPDGLVIWPGQLRGVESDGMIVSGREMHIPGAPNKPGAMILPDSFEVGTPFDVTSDAAQHIFN
ncbi:EMAP domain-containing protein [Secundilactobacillus oryzae JCM 18671]|uniref:EMAP domain-containing protein n=1 Tax=Secundilactobacillus oryzae JCM 18671 TaxID=1291743 RepID=A0A081BG38_9LACO|nr:DUF4479 and tRNA-binding domain-containing protein [Secundilactobacillus oryzae]GAK47006.1 EMAP domain-containing protein [Secundilactobacillus oryzae JCM 18671]